MVKRLGKSHESGIQQDYERLASHYEERWQNYLKGQRAWVLDELAKLDHEPPQNYLDIACGTGVFLKNLQSHYPQHAYTGLDLSSAMIKKAQAGQGPIKFLNQSWRQFYEDNNPYAHDVIVHMNALHHIHNKKRHFEEIASCLKEGGRLFLSDFACDRLPLKMADYYWRVFKSGYAGALSSSALGHMIQTMDLFEIVETTKIKPDRFWQIQLYHLIKI